MSEVNGTASINRCTFSKNRATGKSNLRTTWAGGGAISAVESSPVLSVFNSIFTENSADRGVGCVLFAR